MKHCGLQPADLRYAPCTRDAGHDGPCAHPFDKPKKRWWVFCLLPSGVACLLLALSLPVIGGVIWEALEPRAALQQGAMTSLMLLGVGLCVAGIGQIILFFEQA